MYMYLIGFVVFMVSNMTVQSADVKSEYSVKNEWIHADINTKEGSYIQQLKHKNRAYFPAQPKPAGSALGIAGQGFVGQGFVGQSLRLYKDHPYDSTDVFPLPKVKRIRQLKDIDHNIPSIHWLSETDQDYKMNRIYAMNATEAVFHITTTITNNGVKMMEFYPTEMTVLDVSSDIGKATPDLYLYMSANAGGSVKQASENVKNNEGLIYMPEYNVFVGSHDLSSNGNSTSWRSPKPWFALYDHQDRQTLGFEIKLDKRFIQPINHNLIFQSVHSNIDSSTEVNQSNLVVQNVLGKVSLPPNETFIYVMQFSITNSITPLIDVQNGVAVTFPFHVLEHELGFYVAGTFGVPMEGKFGLIYYNKDGKELRRATNLYGINIDNQKTPYMLNASLQVPAFFSTVDAGFGFNDKQESLVPIIQKEAARVELVLLDTDTNNVIKVLYTANAPWQKYKQ